MDKNTNKPDILAFTKKLTEDLISFFGINQDVSVVMSDDYVSVNIPTVNGNAFLIGHNGETIEAIKRFISSVLRAQEFSTDKVNVDIADYYKSRAYQLEKRTKDWIKQAENSEQPLDLPPMNPAERRLVHNQVTSESKLLKTESIGEGRARHIRLSKVN